MRVDPHSSKAYVFLMTVEAVWLVVAGLSVWWLCCAWFLSLTVESSCALQQCSCWDLQWASGDPWGSNPVVWHSCVWTCSPQQIVNLSRVAALFRSAGLTSCGWSETGSGSGSRWKVSNEDLKDSVVPICGTAVWLCCLSCILNIPSCLLSMLGCFQQCATYWCSQL